jgi:hypothetical protein
VEGRSKDVKLVDALAEMAGRGVKAGEDVRKHFGDPDLTVWYCEFPWAGKVWRTRSLSSQGDTVAGRLNPGDPRDVKWGSEP